MLTSVLADDRVADVVAALDCDLESFVVARREVHVPDAGLRKESARQTVRIRHNSLVKVYNL